MEATLLVQNAAQLVTPVRSVEELQSCRGMGRLEIISDGAIAIQHDKIIAIGKTTDVIEKIKITSETVLVNAHGHLITPGLVDPHTHPVFLRTRENEFEMRIQGKTYQEIAAAGGGIRSSVRAVRQATQDELIEAALPRLNRFLENGVTTIEAKSGYGLSLQDEIKSLQVIKQLNQLHPIELVPTFLGAHEIPDEFRDNRRAYIDLIINEMLPAVSKQHLAEFCDIFCEEHVFSIEESREILLAAQTLGLKAKIHANQLSSNGAAQLAGEIGAISAEHLDRVTPEEILILSKAGVIPILLPGAVFFLNLDHYAPARKMIEAGLAVAISTDYNPGTCMTESLPLMMSLACIKMRMTPAEALIATTFNAAMAINRQDKIGSLAIGKQADLVIWDVPDYRHLAYHFGVQLTAIVIKKGKICYKKNPSS
ncbi:imidazolonepropionase [candidate division KSB1 bacterium]|nr:imidazolonepropionase [candidate division KSB1 bacterium]